MIDLSIDRPYHPEALCECGDAECLGPADAVIPVVEALANAEMHQALWAYCKAKKDWDKRSYQLGGEQ